VSDLLDHPVRTEELHSFPRSLLEDLDVEGGVAALSALAFLCPPAAQSPCEDTRFIGFAPPPKETDEGHDDEEDDLPDEDEEDEGEDLDDDEDDDEDLDDEDEDDDDDEPWDDEEDDEDYEDDDDIIDEDEDDE
jgi:hypothetical protein